MQEELLTKAKNGDVKAYEELINNIKNVLYRLARARLDNEDDIYDAINETIFYAYKHLKKLKHNEYFQTWIIKILINECNKIYNKNSKQLKLIEKIQTISYYENYDNSLREVEDKMDFKKLLETLNYDERMVFILYFYAEYDTTEISKILNENISNVKSRLKRGKEKIYKMISKGGVEYDK